MNNDTDDGRLAEDHHRWLEIADRLREELAARINDINALAIDDCLGLSHALAQALQLQFDCHMFAKSVEDRQRQIYCDTPFQS